jgi:hypothetical protein
MTREGECALNLERVLPIAAALAVVSAVAWACGIEFPNSVLADREAVTSQAPYRSFRAVADALTLPRQPLRGTPPQGSGAEVTADAERRLLGAADFAIVQRMREANSAVEAYARGGTLAEPVRSYTAGAVAFHAAGREPARALLHLAAAETAFGNALAAAATKAHPEWQVWSSYMLGRSLARRPGGEQQAIAAFARTRKIAGAVPDPLQLARASLGEEARIRWRRGETATAVGLYLEQYAQGDEGGFDSLREVIRQTLRRPEELERHASDPRIRRLAGAYLLEGLEFEYSDAGSVTDTVEATDRLDLLVDELIAAAGDPAAAQSAGVDEIAALAYARGRFDLAQRAAVAAQGPLAAAIRARLALRRNDLEAAAKEYASLVRELAGPARDEATGIDGDMLRAEAAIPALARRDYAQALEYLLAAGYWTDAAYVAERVLSPSELIDVVARVAPAGGVGAEAPPELQDALRRLTGRRLLREGRGAAALPFFHGVRDTPAAEGAALEQLARRYIDAAHASRSRWTRVGRAEAAFEAAALARRHGMDLLAFELEPDLALMQGQFEAEGWGPPAPVPSALVTADEVARASANASGAGRFTYRLTAARWAAEAAGGLPPRSQAFAAVLCKAAGWMRDTPGERPLHQSRLYHAYVVQGPHVPWAADFGRRCQEPDFAAARALEWQQRRARVRGFVRDSALPLSAGAGVVILLGIGWFRRRRQEARQP